MNDTYRTSFAREERAAEYDPTGYHPHSYGSLLWEMEKDILDGIVGDVRATHPHIDYLDFATGTGRIISYMENHVDTATGIDISDAMAARAQEKVEKAAILCKDITVKGAEMEGTYDLISAFRFVLNAEKALRLAALKALAGRLKDDSSRLVFNNHANVWSCKILLLPYHKLRSLGKELVPYGIYMSNAEAHKLANQAGLQIERTIGYGFLGGKLAQMIPFDTALRVERKLTRMAAIQPFCCNQMYVAKLQRRPAE